MSNGTVPSGVGPLSLENIDARAKAAAQSARQFRTKQTGKKLLVASTGAAVAVLGMAGAPNPPLTSQPPTPAGFPATINGSCSIDGGKANGGSLDPLDLTKNPLKNRWTLPAPQDFDTSVSISDFFGPDATEQSSKLSENRAVTITGYIADIKSGGAETCNCQTQDKSFWDTHIYLSQTAGAAPKDSMIVELTPRIRMLLKPGSSEWDTSTLASTFKVGSRVTITGWEFFDKEHWPNSANNPSHSTNVWRATCWEVHPVTNIVLASQAAAPAGAGVPVDTNNVDSPDSG